MLSPLDMQKTTPTKNELPDVSTPHASLDWGTTLAWVGMRQVELPIQIQAGETNLQLSARLDFGVSLDRRDARGIHMSRLYRLAAEQLPGRALNFQALIELATAALVSHKDLSKEVRLTLRFELPLQRKALKSEGLGWRTYPIEVELQLNSSGDIDAELSAEILYSSTCPASAALSRQINQRAALAHFTSENIKRSDLESWLESPESVAATPHAQRSLAQIRVKLGAELLQTGMRELAMALIENVENALGTPVQSLVKREDEQEFANRNAQNLMFCEDAARVIAEVLEETPGYMAWQGEVSHFESLHPHDAVAEFSGQKPE